MTQTTDHPRSDEVREVDLAITGMTCASCSARIEKKLGRIDGVDAVVNLATEKATVRFAEPVTVEDLLTTVRATGYGAEVVGAQAPQRGGRAGRPRARPAWRARAAPTGWTRGGCRAPSPARRREP